MSGLDDGLPGGAALGPLELLYRAATAARGLSYDHGWAPVHRLEATVISVGNLIAGGAGKTPLVLTLAERLHAAGRAVAVLARGYRSRGERGVNVIAPGEGEGADPERYGDEAVLIARRLPGVPVLTGADRVLLGLRAIDLFRADTLLLDDGFQHRRLYRDLDLVVLRAPRPFGNGRLLPRGPLREPAAALGRADLLVVNTSDGELAEPLPPALVGARPTVTVHTRPEVLVELDGGGWRPLSALAGRRVIVAAGIARPAALAASATALRAQVIEVVARPDHHRWTEDEVSALHRRARLADALLLTSEKDAVKWRRPPPGALALRVSAQLKHAAPLWARLGIARAT